MILRSCLSGRGSSLGVVCVHENDMFVMRIFGLPPSLRLYLLPKRLIVIRVYKCMSRLSLSDRGAFCCHVVSQAVIVKRPMG